MAKAKATGKKRVDKECSLMKWIAIAIVISTAMVIYFSPFRLYINECEREHKYYSKEMCMWMYFEMRKEESWLRRILLELGY